MKQLTYKNQTYQINYGSDLKSLIPTSLFTDQRLSEGARFVAMYLCSLPKDWVIRIEVIAKNLKIDKKTVSKRLKEIFSSDVEYFKPQSFRLDMKDLDEGIYDVSAYEVNESGLNEFITSHAKDVSQSNVKKVYVVQSERQKYLLNLCFNPESQGLESNTLESHSFTSKDSLESEVFIAKRKGVSPQPPSPEKTKAPLFLFGKRGAIISLRSDLSPCIAMGAFGDGAESSTNQKIKVQGFLKEKVENFPPIYKNEIFIKDSLYAHEKQKTKDFRPKAENSSKPNRAKKHLSDFLDLSAYTPTEQEAIKLWIEYKSQHQKGKLLPAQIDFQLRKIARLKECGQEIVAVIERSIDKGWKGLFPIRDLAFGQKSAGSVAFCDKNGSASARLCDNLRGLSPHSPRTARFSHQKSFRPDDNEQSKNNQTQTLESKQNAQIPIASQGAKPKRSEIIAPRLPKRKSGGFCLFGAGGLGGNPFSFCDENPKALESLRSENNTAQASKIFRYAQYDNEIASNASHSRNDKQAKNNLTDFYPKAESHQKAYIDTLDDFDRAFMRGE